MTRQTKGTSKEGTRETRPVRKPAGTWRDGEWRRRMLDEIGFHAYRFLQLPPPRFGRRKKSIAA